MKTGRRVVIFLPTEPTAVFYRARLLIQELCQRIIDVYVQNKIIKQTHWQTPRAS